MFWELRKKHVSLFHRRDDFWQLRFSKQAILRPRDAISVTKERAEHVRFEGVLGKKSASGSTRWER